ncbi:MAG: hypothetical protein HY657_20305 [Acidobacteria bacterium]|nr:hypothetical protein [Acidobacteriota bacterium]
MLRLTERRRAVVIEKLPDLANLILGSTFLGQFLTDRPFSIVLAAAGVGVWAGLACSSLWWPRMGDYLGIFIIGAGVLLITGTVVLLDWLARRKERQSRDRAA